MNSLTFPVLRLLSHTEFRSGEEMAASLGVSRASISNALADLSGLGVAVYRLRGRGYRLVAPIDWLTLAALRGHLGTSLDGHLIEIVDTVESTNSSLIEKAARDAPHGSVLIAEYQTRGKGRRGRRWEASLGGTLTFSLLWRFNQGLAQLGGLSLAVGVALLRALRQAGLGDVAVKWPNDLVHHYRKLGGVLIELQGEALGPAVAVIGIGINLSLSEEAKSRIDQAVVDVGGVLGQVPDRNALLATVLRHLVEVLAEFEAGGFAALRDEWEAGHAYQGRQVSLLLPSGSEECGEVLGVATDGTLLVMANGQERRYASGEISLRPSRV